MAYLLSTCFLGVLPVSYGLLYVFMGGLKRFLASEPCFTPAEPRYLRGHTNRDTANSLMRAWGSAATMQRWKDSAPLFCGASKLKGGSSFGKFGRH